MHEGIIDGLGPAAAPVACHDGRDNVDQLGQARDLDPIRIAQQRDQHGTDQKRVFEVVDILQQRQSPVPLVLLPDLLILLAGMVPDVPLVEGEIDLLFAVFLSLHRIADGYYALDKVIHIHRPGEEARRVAGRVGIVAVQGNIVDVLIALVQHRELPVAEARHL